MFLRFQRVHIDDEQSIDNLTGMISKTMSFTGFNEDKQLIILCVGTDRSTGDSLGPLIGSELKKANINATVIGDIHNPCHGSNLHSTIEDINNNYDNPYIIAIDSGLGKESSVGSIDCKKGKLQPGTGVNKKLPHVGDMHIGGLVNVGGYMEYMVLQSTRLSVVVKMAEIISESLLNAVGEVEKSVEIEEHHSRIDDQLKSLHKALKPAFERFTI